MASDAGALAATGILLNGRNPLTLSMRQSIWGINFFDVAPVYGWGVSETILGEALKDGKRNHVMIASKAGLTWEKKFETKNDLSRANLFRRLTRA